MLRALEHHVLKKVSESSAPGHFVRRANVIPDVGGDERQAMILGQNHNEAIRQGVFLKLDGWQSDLCGFLRGGSSWLRRRRLRRRFLCGVLTENGSCREGEG